MCRSARLLLPVLAGTALAAACRESTVCACVPPALRADPASLQLAVGGRAPVVVAVQDAEGPYRVSWATSAPAVAVIDSVGAEGRTAYVRAVSEGQALLTATASVGATAASVAVPVTVRAAR